MSSYPVSGASVFAKAIRLSQLDSTGKIIVASPVWVTDQLMKATLAPVVETGDDIAIKAASGDLAVIAKHGDMVKRWGVTLEFATVLPNVSAFLDGGTAFQSVVSALGAPSSSAGTGYATTGSLIAGTYQYQVAQFNQNGISTPSNAISVAVGGTTVGAVILKSWTLTAGALGAVIYGRSVNGSGTGLLGYVRNVAGQATSAASGTGTVTTLTVTALTVPIPVGFTFVIAGDTNTVPIVFTTTQAAGVGATTIYVSTSQATIATTITASTITPCFLDTGVLVPGNAPNSVDLTAGPGIGIGYQTPQVGKVGNPNGVGLELFGLRYQNGDVATDYPTWYHVMPKVANLVIQSFDITNANAGMSFKGDAFQNPNWGSGPDGTIDIDTSKVYQNRMLAQIIVPAGSSSPGSAL